MSTLSTPVPARPITLRRVGALDQVRGQLGRRADQDRRRSSPIAARSSSSDHLEAEVDVEALAQQVDAGVGDLLLDQDLHRSSSPTRTFSITQSMQAVSASTSAGSTAGNMPIAQLVAPQLAVGLDVDDAVGAQRSRPARRRRPSRRSRSCRPPASASPGRRRTASRTRCPRPSRRGGRRRRGVRCDAPVEAAPAEHPLDLVGEQEQRRQRGRVVGLVLARVLERRRQREEGRLPAPGDAVELARSARSPPGSAAASQSPPSAPKAFCGAK